MKNLIITLTLLISLSSFSQDYAINVTADSRNDYKLVGIDSNGEINGLDVDLIFKNGSEIVFNVNSPGHPFVIKSQPGIGKKNILKEVQNNNISKGVVKWTPTSPGTYYYQCIKHKNMYGKIIIR
jgi:plastocyanin